MTDVSHPVMAPPFRRGSAHYGTGSDTIALSANGTRLTTCGWGCTGLCEDPPGLQPCDPARDRGACCRQRAVDGLLGWCEAAACWASAWCCHPWAGSEVGAVGEDRDALAFADSDDPVGAGRGQVVRAAGQCGLDPQQSSDWIGDHLHVHAVTSLFWEKSARLSPTRSHSARVPSSRT
jgi:hypothetical protein